MPLQSISLIFSPYHVGLRDKGPGAGPTFLRSHGLVQALQSLGVVVHSLEIPPIDDDSDFQGEIGRSFEILRRTSELVAQARDRRSFPIVLSGNCCATVGVAGSIFAAVSSDELDGRQNDVGCVWFDAHDDYNTPDTVVSGYFDSMGIAMLAGECWRALLADVPGHRPLDVGKMVHVGMRDVTDAERQRVVDAGLDVVWGNSEESVDFAARLGETLVRKRLGPTLVHVDLDCLDISVGQVNKFAAPGGLFEEDLSRCLERVVAFTEPLSLTVASFDPSYDSAEKIAKIAVEAVKGFVASLVSKGVFSPECIR